MPNAKDSLKTREQVSEALARTEGFTEVNFKLGTGNPEFVQDGQGNVLFRVTPTGQASGREYSLTKDAMIKAARFCGIPETYVNKFADEDIHLMNPHLTHWFNKRNDELNLLVASDNNTVVSFNKKTIGYYSRARLIELAEEVLAPSLEEKESLLFDKVSNSLDGGLQIGIVTNKQQFMNPGDLIRGGIQIQDHVLGELPLVITGYTWRQVCGNGALSQEIVGKWSRRGSLENLNDWFKQSIEDAHKAIDGEFVRIKAMQNVKLSNHGADVLKAMFAEMGVSNALRTAITDEVVNNGGDTMYDIFNAITAAANDENLIDSPMQIRRLQQLAGKVTNHSNICPACFSLVHN